MSRFYILLLCGFGLLMAREEVPDFPGRILPGNTEPILTSTTMQNVSEAKGYVDIEADPVAIVNDTNKLYVVVEHTFYKANVASSFVTRLKDVRPFSWAKGLLSSTNAMYIMPPKTEKIWSESMIQRDKLYHNVWFGTFGSMLPTLYLDVFEVPITGATAFFAGSNLATLKPVARIRLYLKSYLARVGIISKEKNRLLLSRILKKYSMIPQQESGSDGQVEQAERLVATEQGLSHLIKRISQEPDQLKRERYIKGLSQFLSGSVWDTVLNDLKTSQRA